MKYKIVLEIDVCDHCNNLKNVAKDPLSTNLDILDSIYNHVNYDGGFVENLTIKEIR